MFKIEEKIIVNNYGQVYPEYDEWANKYFPKSAVFENHATCKKNDIGIIVAKAPHLTSERIMLYAVTLKNGKTIIIEESGLSKCEWHCELTKEDLVNFINEFFGSKTSASLNVERYLANKN